MSQSPRLAFPDVRPALISRLMGMVEVTGPFDCWGWKGYTNPQTGYGQITLNSLQQSVVGQRIITAPRLMAYIAFGPPHDGQQVLHQCDHKPCTNPLHLRWGTQAENNREAWDRGAQAWGPDHHRTRYPTEVVEAVREAVASGSSVKAAAEANDVNLWTAYSWFRGGRPRG